MNKRYCQTGRIECPHLPACEEDCHFDTASLRGRTILIKSVEEPEPGAGFQAIGQVMIGSIMAALFVFFVLMFFTGVYLWSLLI